MSAKEQKAVAAVTVFNEEFPVGSAVRVKLDGEEKLLLTETTSSAWVMCEQPVVMLKNVSGAYHIRCVQKANG
jgi:hypothetical protein